jgi:integrase
MLTGQRRSETAAIRASWIGDGTVTYPETITKNKHEHVLPVASMAQSLLRSGGADALFVARGTEDTPFNGWSKSKQALDKRLGHSLAYWQLHDLRRTYRTIHARIGTPPHIAERLINHVSSVSEIEKIYDRHTYRPDMEKAVHAFEQWFSANVIEPTKREAA